MPRVRDEGKDSDFLVIPSSLTVCSRAGFERGIGYCQGTAEPIGRKIPDRPRSAFARLALREGRGAGGMERHLALDLLHDLVNVTVQYGDGAKPPEKSERLNGVLRAPAPFF